MSDAKPHLRTLEEIERTRVPGLVEVLRTEGVEGVRYALWDITGWHRDYDPCVWRSRATEERKRVGWESWVRMEKIVATVLHEAHERQVEEVFDALDEGPEGFYRSSLDPTGERHRPFGDVRASLHLEQQARQDKAESPPPLGANRILRLLPG